MEVSHNTIYTISLKLLLRNANGRVLALRPRSTNGFMRGFYDLPGGRISTKDIDGSLEGTLRREIAEELGEINYTIRRRPVGVGQQLKRAALGPTANIMYVVFEGRYIGGDIAISSEHSAYRWLAISKDSIDHYFTGGLKHAMTLAWRKAL